ncbi:MAG: two-component system, NarL family, sensor histidine kinase BarA [Parcubacteria bacterium C7867-007]|nr:MAG: two-component system, NarL family, sensor histidine kinase BarA [Parcubacteria bacterium C7867-007]
MICEWDIAQYLIFSGNGEPLIYYSHLTSIAIFIGLLGFTFLKLRQWPKNTFRLMALAYIVWLFCDLVLWANEGISNVMFFWTIINLVEPLIFVFAYAYFVQFVEGRSISMKGRWLIFLLLVPTLIMAPIGLSVIGFDYTDCDRNVVEGIAAYYNYFLEALFLTLTVVKTVNLFLTKKVVAQRNKLLAVSVGTTLLMFSFLVANYLGTVTGDYVTSQYGHIAVPFFAAFLAFITIKYESFEPRILLIDTLVVALFIDLLSLFFVRVENYQIYANVVAILIMIPLGYTLLTGIRREVRARKEIQQLAENLEIANKQQVTLIHFITHQIKGFVTKSRNIFSMTLEGDFGPISDQLRPMIEEGFRSDTKGVTTIQEILNAANIKSGKVTYQQVPFDLKELIEEIVKDIKSAADAKGLALTFEAAGDSFTFNGDRQHMLNALKNLIDNSIKYTPTGTVAVTLTKEGSIFRFTIKDTGIGITPEDMAHLFTEGGHGKESIKVNVESTGFGLYIVKNIIDAHKGTVRAESEGAGKGSTFIVELPA